MKILPRDHWLWGPLLGSILLPLVWGMISLAVRLSFPWIEIQLNAFTPHPPTLGDQLIFESPSQILLGCILGTVTAAAWQFRSRVISVGAGILITAYLCWQRWELFDFSLVNFSFFAAQAIRDALEIAPSVLWSICLIFFGVCARKKQTVES